MTPIIATAIPPRAGGPVRETLRPAGCVDLSVTATRRW
jgi:hypothetical protein